ncbi:MAG: carbon-nitrogen hydrolase family protein, partial [Nitrospinota bacterium]|nr:carbon-nitrogen hydrolase family protein [Nitrospinota bacterium]
MKVKVAGVQALSYYGEEEYKNVEVAVRMIREAAAEKVDLVVLSEGFPGPNSGPMDSGGKLPCRPMETMREMARESRVHLVAGELEENPEIENTYYLTLKLISPEGEIMANYARRQPDHMELNSVLSGGKEHVLPFSNQKGLSERELHGVVGTPFGTEGLSICS